jgi:exopolyphosphatase/guanosine-5'-triphosphate,3'-diphosphate pyrophosphatase
MAGRRSAEVVARWEWRTFGERFGAAEARLAEAASGSVHESDELYLLSPAVEESVKVRDGLLDVKQLVQVSADGLEQWRPVTKAPFPVDAADLAAGLARLHVGVPPLSRAAYTLEELLAEVVPALGGVSAVDVHKRRARTTLGGCLAELTSVRAGDRETRTIAVESEDPERVAAVVSGLGLAGRPNVSMPRGLKALLGIGASRYAAIDVGTNSVKLHVGERGADGTWRAVAERSEITRLGEGLEASGRLAPAAGERTVEAIAALAEEARRLGAEAVVAVGTAGLRRAADSAAFVAAVEARCGVRVGIISGEEEARLSFLAATSALGPVGGPLVVFETGGGSTQFTFGHGDHVDERFSVDVGAVRFTERFGLDGAVPAGQLAAALDAIGDDLARLDGRSAPDELVGMGGALTNLAAVKHELAAYDAEVVQGTVLDRAELDRQLELYRTRSADERRGIAGLQPKRAEVILAGGCIVRTVLEKLGRESLTVSDRGLRHRLLVERFPSRDGEDAAARG